MNKSLNPLSLMFGVLLILLVSCDPFDLRNAAGVQEITVSVDQDRYVLFEEFSADWQSDLPVGDVRWELRKGGELIEVIEDGWSVHEGIGSGTDYRLRVVSEESDQVYGESGDFAILTYLLLGGNGDDWGDALELDDEGNIFIAGRSASSNIGGNGQSSGDGAVTIKINHSGDLDAGYGVGGYAYIESSTGDLSTQMADLVLLPDSRVFVSGAVFGSTLEGASYLLTANGTLDNTFNGDGERIFIGSGHDVIHKAILHPDGDKILTCGRFASNDGDYLNERMIVVSDYSNSDMDAFVQLLSFDGTYNEQFTKFGSSDLAGISTIGGSGGEMFADLVAVPDGEGGYHTTLFGSTSHETIQYQGGSYPGTANDSASDTVDGTDILISGFTDTGGYRKSTAWCNSWGSLAYGGSGTDKLTSGVYDGSGYWACGYSDSSDFEAVLVTQGSYDILLSRFNNNGFLQTTSCFLWGGSGSDVSNKILMAGDKLYLLGSSSSDDFDPDGDGTYLEKPGDVDGLILRCDGTTGDLDTSFGQGGGLAIGGNAYDIVNDAVVDAQGTLYCLGTSASPDIPGQSLKGGKDIFLVVLKP